MIKFYSLIFILGLHLLFLRVQCTPAEITTPLTASVVDSTDSSDDDDQPSQNSFSAGCYENMYLQIKFYDFQDCFTIYFNETMSFQAVTTGSYEGSHERIIMFTKAKTRSMSPRFEARMKIKQFVTKLSIFLFNDRTLVIPSMPIILPCEFQMIKYLSKTVNSDVFIKIYNQTQHLEYAGVVGLRVKLDIMQTINSPLNQASPLTGARPSPLTRRGSSFSF